MKITDEQMRDYEIDLANHNNWYNTKLKDLETILSMVEKFGVEETRRIYTDSVETSRSLNEPNRPGYYRANND